MENNNHTVFDPVKSSTYKEEEGLTWRISYGDGSFASGLVGSDNVNIGGLAIKDQVVELADVLSEHFTRGAGDGLLGLALGNINSVKSWATSTPVENIISQSGIPESAALFTAKLGSWQDTDELDKGGFFYTFGYIDQDTVKATGAEIHYTPVDKSQGFWLFESTSATVNRQSFSRSGNKAIADTGTALALVDDEACQAIYDAIPGAQYDDVSQGWIYPSNTRADKLPIVSFDIGGKQFVLQKEDLGFAEAKSGYVYGGIQSRGTMTMDILGGTFLKAIYAVSGISFVSPAILFANLIVRSLMLAIFALVLCSGGNCIRTSQYHQVALDICIISHCATAITCDMEFCLLYEFQKLVYLLHNRLTTMYTVRDVRKFQSTKKSTIAVVVDLFNKFNKRKVSQSPNTMNP